MRWRKPDYKRKDFVNPFFKKNRGAKPRASFNFSWKVKLSGFGVIAFLILFFWLLFFSGIFGIKDVKVEGTSRVLPEEIKETVIAQTGERRWLFLRQDNFFVFNEKELTDTLNAKYNFRSIKISHNYFKRTLRVGVEEKKYSLIWNEGDSYYYLSDAGDIISAVSPLDIANGQLPLVSNTAEARVENGFVRIKKETLQAINNLFDKIKNNNYNISIERFLIDNDDSSIKIKPATGPQLIFNLSGDFDEQISKLVTLRDQVLKNNFNNLGYVDLRFADKVYYR